MSAKDFPLPQETRHWGSEDFLRLEEMRGEGPSPKQGTPFHDRIGWVIYGIILAVLLGLFVRFGQPQTSPTSSSSSIYLSPVR